MVGARENRILDILHTLEANTFIAMPGFQHRLTGSQLCHPLEEGVLWRQFAVLG